jgi:hypothetical protein
MLEVSTDDEWITGLTAEEKAISFSLTAGSPSEERSGSIRVSYEGAEPVSVEIRQKKEDVVPLGFIRKFREQAVGGRRMLVSGYLCFVTRR